MRWWIAFGLFMMLAACRGNERAVGAAQLYQQAQYEHAGTRDIVALVEDAANLVRAKGEAAFADLRVSGSRWRRGESYVFVLDPRGDMLVHPDTAMEGKNELELKDVNGKPIIRGLIAAATSLPNKRSGWYHYEWPVPNGIAPRWKSSYVELVTAPSGANYIVGSGVYDDRMERTFAVDLVNDAVGQIDAQGEAAFSKLRDPKDRFIVKDTYVFVLDSRGVMLVSPAFPSLEGRSLLALHDTQGREPVREMVDIARTRGSGWVDYMWPKPGEDVSTQKTTYVSRAGAGGQYVVGCGVYLAQAPKAPIATMSAPELMTLVRDGAAEIAKRGAAAYPDMRRKGSKWFHDDTYFFVWKLDGTRVFHAADPSHEGTDGSIDVDVMGRAYGKMILDAAKTPSGEGWVQYLYAHPGTIFPVWKSSFVKRVALPSGDERIVGSGVYNMKIDKAMIEDVVDRASALVAERGAGAFDALRDKTGPFVFMDTYVFVDTTEGVELVNGGQPSLEGKNLKGLRDVNGKAVADAYIAAASKDGHAWVDYYWYKPGDNTPAQKETFVRKVSSGKDVYIVGAGLYR